MSPAGRAWCLAAAVCTAVLLADQVAKRIAEQRIVVGEEVDVLGPLQLTLTHNEGVAFGFARGSGAPLAAITALGLAAVVYLFWRQPTRPLMWLAAGLVAGGALGNLVDRVRVGAVTDFIQLPHWPAFNLADAAITCGVVLMVGIYLWEAERGGR